jgi:hypothetical protein
MISGGAIMDGVYIPKKPVNPGVKGGGGKAGDPPASVGNAYNVTISAAARENQDNNGDNSGQDNQEGGENLGAFSGLYGLGNYHVDTSHMIFLQRYLDSMKRVCEKLGQMFELSPKDKKAQEAWVKMLLEKRDILKQLMKKIDLAKMQAKDVVDLAATVTALVARLNNNPGDTKAAAAVVEALSRLSGKLGSLATLSAQIDKQISALPLSKTDKQYTQLKAVSAKLKKAIKTYTKIFNTLHKQLAGA